jgi:hypothetical protein
MTCNELDLLPDYRKSLRKLLRCANCETVPVLLRYARDLEERDNADRREAEAPADAPEAPAMPFFRRAPMTAALVGVGWVMMALLNAWLAGLFYTRDSTHFIFFT